MRLRTSGIRVTGERPVMFKAEIRTYLLATKLWTTPAASLTKAVHFGVKCLLKTHFDRLGTDFIVFKFNLKLSCAI